MTPTQFDGTLGVEDMARHVPHRFAVPPGTRTLRLAFAFSPEMPETGPLPHQLSISVYGPDGARGTRHNNDDQSPVISETWASPGYTAGPIAPGDWCVEIDTHRILPPGNLRYRLTVEADTRVTEGPLAAERAAVSPREAGWYLGDLHGHSDHSDGSWPVADFVAHARNIGLDFVSLTDHNTISGLAEARALAGDDLLVVGGTELTTFNGHCLALGTDAWVDWRIKDGQTMAGRAEDLISAGLTYVIAHPMAPGHPWCTGCHWAYADVFPGPARLVEIWNGPWDARTNEAGLMLFQRWLNDGYRMRATAGTDIHGPRPRRDTGQNGYNRVWAEALSEAAILAGIRAGHNLLTAGPILSLSVEAGGVRTGIGDLAPACAEAVVDLAWDAAPADATLTILAGGPLGTEVVHSCAAPSTGTHRQSLSKIAERGWLMATLRGGDGTLLALTNPVFFPGTWR